MSASSVATPPNLSPQEEERTSSVVAHAHDTLASGLLFMMVANVGQRAIGFFRNLSFCRFLDEGGLGLWALASSFLMLAAPLAVLGLPGTFGKLVESFRVRGQLSVFLKRVAIVCSLSVTVVVATLLAFYETAGNWILGSPVSLLSIAGIAFALCAVILFNTSTELLNGLRRGRLVSKMHTVNSMSFTAISVIGLLLFPDWRVIVVAFALAALLGILPGLKCIRGSLSGRVVESNTGRAAGESKVFWGRVIPFAVSIWVMNLLANLFDIVDRYMILYLSESHEVGVSLVGQFHSARILPVLLTSLTLMLSSLLLPYLAADWESGQRNKVGKSIQLTMKAATYFFFMLSIGAMAVAPLLFNQMLEGRYSQGLGILPLALTHCCFMATATLLQNYFWCIERGRVVGVILGVGLIVNVGLNAWWVPRYGLEGAMSATAIAGAVILLSTFVVLRMHGVRLDRASIALCFLPLALLVSPVFAVVVGFVTLCIASRTKLLLSVDEKRRIDDAVIPQLSRLKVQIRSLWHHP